MPRRADQQPEAPPGHRWRSLLEAVQHAVQRRLDIEDQPTLRAGAAAVQAAWSTLPEPIAALDRALDGLGARAGLAPFDVDVLAIAIAAEIDPALAGTLDLLRPRPGGTEHPSVGVVFELLGVPTTSAPARARIGAGGTLQRSGLLRLSDAGSLLSRQILLPDRVVAHLLGDDTLDPALEPYLTTLPAMELPGGETLAGHWRSGEHLVWVRGAPGTAGAAMAAGAAVMAGLGYLAVDLDRAGSARHDSVLRAAILEAVLRGAALVLTGPRCWLEQESGVDPVDAVARLRRGGVPVAVVSSAAWNRAWASWLPVTLAAPQLSSEDRVDLWASHLPSEPEPTDPEWADLLALQVTPEEVDVIADLVRGEHGEISVERLREASRRLSDGRLSAPRARATFEDLVLPADLAAGLKQLVSWARHRDSVLAQGPLTGKGKGRGITALFTGSPGTGKTLAASVIAESLGLDLFPVDLSGVVDKYVGETEKNLERVFQAAERLNCVLFFDEADSLFSSRSEIRDSRDRYANLEVSYLLQRMEQFDGIAVLATNLRGNLDVAFSRRLHFVLHFPDPDEATRAALWRQHLAHLHHTDPDDPVNIDHLAKVAEVTGGDVRNAVLAAAYSAAEERAAVGMRHVVAGLEREYRKLGRRVPDGGFAPARPRKLPASRR